MSRPLAWISAKLLALVKARAGLLIAVTLIAAGLALVVSLSQD